MQSQPLPVGSLGSAACPVWEAGPAPLWARAGTGRRHRVIGRHRKGPRRGAATPDPGQAGSTGKAGQAWPTVRP